MADFSQKEPIAEDSPALTSEDAIAQYNPIFIFEPPVAENRRVFSSEYLLDEDSPALLGVQRKEKLLEDLLGWLDEAPDDALLAAEAFETEEPEPDLHSLLSEMIALRQEVRLQSRQEAKASREIVAAREAIEATIELANQQRQASQQAQQEAAQRSISTWALGLLDIRDALARGLVAAQKRAADVRLSWWQRLLGHYTDHHPVNCWEESYQMVINRCDRVLKQHGIDKIETVGKPFNATFMVAVEVTSIDTAEDNVVMDEIQSGCMAQGRILRCAEVVVNRHSTNVQKFSKTAA